MSKASLVMLAHLKEGIAIYCETENRFAKMVSAIAILKMMTQESITRYSCTEEEYQFCLDELEELHLTDEFFRMALECSHKTSEVMCCAFNSLFDLEYSPYGAASIDFSVSGIPLLSGKMIEYFAASSNMFRLKF